MNDATDNIEVSYVMPCLNEAETLERCIQKALQAIKQHKLNAEIIVADNGSTDGSQKIAVENGANVVHVKTKGYGSALSGGIAAAAGKYIIMADADDSYDFSDTYLFVDKLRQGYDLVMGCRFPRGGGKVMPGAMPLKHRILGNPVLSFIGRLFFKTKVKDFHCGLRAFTKEAIAKMNLRTTGMEFASEMVVKASLAKMKIAEVPIILYKDGRSRPPHLRSWQDGWRHLRFLLMYAPNWLFLYPGLVLFGLGFFFFFLISQQPLTIGTITFEKNTSLVMAMTALIGFQLMSFYLFVKVYAVSEGFLPNNPIVDRLLSFATLEVGILSGGLFLVTGLGVLAYSFVGWSQVGFGALTSSVGIQMVIPAITFMLLGVQIIFSSFFLSILGLPKNR